MNSGLEICSQVSLEQSLCERSDICSSASCLDTFPAPLHNMFFMEYIGLIVCERGSFSFFSAGREETAHEGQTVFLPENVYFRVLDESPDLRVRLLFYKVDPIREILGNSVQVMRLYASLNVNKTEVWTTGDEQDIVHYMALLARYNSVTGNEFDKNERKLLLLSLTYRLCSIYSVRLSQQSGMVGRKKDIFLDLIHLVSKHYAEHRDVAFYADQLCLSPKYLSVLVKSVCGYTVQQLVFKAIVRHCIFMLHNTNKTVKEISDYHHFPNISAFGTFFKKHTGLSPRHFRRQQ